MKNNLFQSFRQRIAVITIFSALITFIAELLFIFVFDRFNRYLRDSGYRSAYMDKNGFDPRLRLMLMVLLGIAIFIFCFWLCLRSTMNYLEQLSKGIKQISDGDLHSPLPVKGNDEFAKIALNINVMIEEIKILMARERIAENTKNDLITSVAHDLRTPLTSIIGYLDLIRSGRVPDEETTDKYLDIAYNKSKRLEKLTNDLFGFAKLNHGKMTMKPAKLDIVKLMGQLLDEFYPSFQEKNLEYEFDSGEPSIIIEADGNLLARLFDNLISNAIKYGADGKMIKVSINVEKEGLISILVINYGKVIPSHELENIFQKFYRVDQSRSQDTGGTGLGLAIAKSVVQMHGGTIEARSDLHGTVFEVKLFSSLTDNFHKFDS